MSKQNVKPSYVYKNLYNNLVKREFEIFGPLSSLVQLGNDNADLTTIKGKIVFIDSPDFRIKDKLTVINSNGAASSGYSCGFAVEENGSLTGYLQTSSNRTGWLLKAPGSFEAEIKLSSLTANHNYTMPNADGTFMLGSGGTVNRLAYWDTVGSISSLSDLTDGKILIGRTGLLPAIANITGTAHQVGVTSASGSITLSLPQDVDTTSTPTFYDLKLNGITSLLTTLSTFVTNSSLSSTLSNYVTTSYLTSNYVSNTSLSATLASYVTSTSLSATLASYVTSTSLSATLADYVTNSSLSSTLSSYATTASLANYATTSALSAHENLTTAHGSTSAATANAIVQRNAQGVAALNLTSPEWNPGYVLSVRGLLFGSCIGSWRVYAGFPDYTADPAIGKTIASNNLTSDNIMFVGYKYYDGSWKMGKAPITMTNGSDISDSYVEFSANAHAVDGVAVNQPIIWFYAYNP